jgi:DNA-binding XRE family transcriptional regulator
MPRPKKEESTGFAARLRELRGQAGLTQDGLAEMAGLNRFSVAKLEQGHREPNWPTVLRLAAALRVGVQAFAQMPTEPTAAPKKSRGRPRKNA